nr:hypothetical protein [Tanacetum cinerariifolium]
FEVALRNRVLLWWLKIRVLLWTVLIDSSLVLLTVLILIEIIALETIFVVVLMSRLIKSRWTHLVRNILLTVLNEISDDCGLKLLDIIVKYWKIISSSSEWTLIIAMVCSASYTYFLDCFDRCSGSNERIFHIVERFLESVHAYV